MSMLVFGEHALKGHTLKRLVLRYGAMCRRGVIIGLALMCLFGYILSPPRVIFTTIKSVLRLPNPTFLNCSTN